MTTAMASASYTVVGMTCGHCVSAVETEVRAVPGVRDVAVELASGLLTVHSVEPVDPGTIRAAVDEAGYELVEPAEPEDQP